MMDIDDEEKHSWFSFLGENKFQFHMVNAIFAMLIMCLCFLLLSLTVFDLFDDWHSYSIKQTEVLAVLNSDDSADLIQAFHYRGSLKHGPIVKIEGPHQVKLKSFAIMRDGKFDRLRRVKHFDLSDHDGQYTVDYDSDDDNDLPMLKIKAYDPLKKFENYTVIAHVQEPHVANRKGIVKWNLLGSSSDVGLGKVTAKVVNHNSQIKKYYMQSDQGVLSHGLFSHPATAVIHHFAAMNHLDLRTNLPVAGPLKKTKLFKLVRWTVVIAFALIGVGYLIIVKFIGVGISFAIPDEVIDDPFTAVLKTPIGGPKASVFSGLLAKLYIEGHVTKTTDGLAWDGKSDQELNEDEQELLGIFFVIKDEENNVWISKSTVDYDQELAQKVKDLRYRYEDKEDKLNQLVGGFGFCLMLIAILFLGLELSDVISDPDFITSHDLHIVVWSAIAMVVGSWLTIYFLSVVSDPDIIKLTQFANGLKELDTISELTLDNSYLWEGLLYWLVATNISDNIVEELVVLGVNQGYISSDESAVSMASALTEISRTVSRVSARSDFSSGGGSFGGGDAGSGGGAGGW